MNKKDEFVSQANLSDTWSSLALRTILPIGLIFQLEDNENTIWKHCANFVLKKKRMKGRGNALAKGPTVSNSINADIASDHKKFHRCHMQLFQ